MFNAPMPAGDFQMRVSRFLLCEVAGHHNQYLRPYRASADGQFIHDISNHLRQTGVITTNGLAKLNSQFISPSAAPNASVHIENGWNERRFRFMMVVDFKMGLVEQTEIVCGYTDFPGISNTGAIAHDMTFYINSVIPTIKHTIYSQTAPKQVMTLNGPSHVLSADKFLKANGAQETVYSLTPSSISSRMITNTYDFYNETMDLAGDITRVPTLSKRDNTVANRYTANILGAIGTELMSNSVNNVKYSDRDLLVKARESLSENSTYENNFMAWLMNINGHIPRSFFKYKEILGACPDIDSVTQVIFRKPHMFAYDHTNTQHLGGADLKTQLAVTIANILPGLLMEFGMYEVDLTATNNHIGGGDQVIFVGGQMINNAEVNLGPYLESLRLRLLNELLPIISQNGMVQYVLSVNCNIIGNTFIKLSLNGGEETPYILPSFADALYNPIVTNDYNDHMSLTNAFSTAFKILRDVYDSGGITIGGNNQGIMSSSSTI